MSVFSIFDAASARFKNGIFNSAGRGGPRRLIIIAGAGVSMIALSVAISMNSQKAPGESQVAKMKNMNLLPGGAHSTPELEALRVRHSQEEARKAEAAKASYTPAMPGSLDLNARSPKEVGVDEPLEKPVKI